MLMNMVWRTLPGWRLCIIEGKDLTDCSGIPMQVFPACKVHNCGVL